MTRPLFRSDMLERLRDFYPSTVTIKTWTEVQDATTGEVTMTWADFAGHVDLPCSIAPSGVQEVKQPDQTYVVRTHTIALRSSHSDITEKMRAVADGHTYDIVLVEVSSHDLVTRLGVRLVE